MEIKGVLTLDTSLFGMAFGGTDGLAGGFKPLKPPLSITIAPGLQELGYVSLSHPSSLQGYFWHLLWADSTTSTDPAERWFTEPHSALQSECRRGRFELNTWHLGMSNFRGRDG